MFCCYTRRLSRVLKLASLLLSLCSGTLRHGHNTPRDKPYALKPKPRTLNPRPYMTDVRTNETSVLYDAAEAAAAEAGSGYTSDIVIFSGSGPGTEVRRGQRSRRRCRQALSQRRNTRRSVRGCCWSHGRGPCGGAAVALTASKRALFRSISGRSADGI